MPAPPHADDPAARLRLWLSALLGALVTASTIWPQGAFPRESLAIGGGIAFCAAAACALGFMDARARLAWPWPAALALWAGAWLLAQARSPAPFLGRPEVATMLQAALAGLAACALVAGAQDKREALRRVAWGLAALGALHAAFAIYHLHGPAWLPRTRAGLVEALAADASASPHAEAILHAMREGRATGFLGSPNMLAGLLGPCALAALALAGTEAARRRAIAAAIALLVLVALFLTGSRGGFLGFLAGAAVLGALLLGGGGVLARRAPAAASMLLLVAATSACENSRWFGITTIQQRIAYWDASIRILGDNGWLLGAGAGGFQAHYPAARAVGANETIHAHSFVFEWLVDGGVVALAAFAVLLAVAAIGMRARWSEDRARAAWLPAVVACLLVHGLVDFTLNWREIALLLFVVLGVAAGAAGKPVSRAVGSIAGVALAAACAAMLWPMQARPALAQLAQEQARDLALVGDEPAALEAYGRALAWERDNAPLLEAQGLLRLRLGDPRGADDLERALRAHPQSARLHEQLALLAHARGQLAEALRLQREAVARHPADPGHRMTLAELALEAGDLALAREQVAFLAQPRLLFTREEAARRDALLAAHPALAVDSAP